MMTAILIDDEVRGRLALRQKLTTYCPQVQVLGEATNGEQGIQMIEKLNPEVVFLDIEMPRMNGFDMLQQIGKKNFHLIFTTAYDQYAIKAIKFAAFDYLLKPVDIAELQKAIEKIESEQAPVQHPEKLETLQLNLNSQFALHKIAIPTMEGLLFFNIRDIIYLQADSNYSTVHFLDHPPLLTTKTLGDFEDILPSSQFFRPHHSFIINLQYIKRYLKGDGGQIELQNGHFVDVSRSKKSDFLKIIR